MEEESLELIVGNRSTNAECESAGSARDTRDTRGPTLGRSAWSRAARQLLGAMSRATRLNPRRVTRANMRCLRTNERCPFGPSREASHDERGRRGAEHARLLRRCTPLVQVHAERCAHLAREAARRALKNKPPVRRPPQPARLPTCGAGGCSTPLVRAWCASRQSDSA